MTTPLSVVRQAKLLDISRGAVYYQPRPTSGADEHDAHALDLRVVQRAQEW